MHIMKFDFLGMWISWYLVRASFLLLRILFFSFLLLLMSSISTI